MFSRLIALLTLLGFLAGQLASVPHAHGMHSLEEQRRHDAQPHIHWGGHARGHDHRPAVSFRHGDHSHVAPIGDPASRAAMGCLAPAAEGSRLDHDADAIYLPVVSPAAEIGAGERAAPAAVALSSGVPIDSWPATEQQEAPVLLRPPAALPSGGKLFLKLRHLRI